MSMWPDHNLQPTAGTATPPTTITSLDEPWRSTAFKTLIAVAMLEPLLVIGVLLAVGAPLWVFAVIVVAGVALPAGVLWLVVAVLWNSSARRYPPQPILPGAVSKSWQSFGFGSLKRFNNCMTIVADEQHLHVSPMALLRIFGARTASLPFDRMRDLRPVTAGTMIRATLDGRNICGPAWCMNLANPAPSGASSTSTPSRDA